MRPLLPALALLLSLAPLSGCMKPIMADTYAQAMEEMGRPPDSCDTKPDGRTYCSWVIERSEAVNWEYKLIMLFDEQGRLIRKYPRSYFRVR